MCSSAQAQGFLNKALKKVEQISKPEKKTTESSEVDNSTSKKSEGQQKVLEEENSTFGAKYPEGYRNNVFGATEEELLGMVNFKKTAQTKIVTLDDIYDIKLANFSDDRVFVSTKKNGLYCFDSKGNVVKHFDRNTKTGRFLFGIEEPCFHDGRFVYEDVSEGNYAVIVDKNFKEIKRVKRATAYSGYRNGIAMIAYDEPNPKMIGTPIRKFMYVDVNGNQVMKNLSDFFEQAQNIYIKSGSGVGTRPLNDGLAAFPKPMPGSITNFLWGFRDGKGNIVIEPKYSRVQDFHNGLAAVATNVQGVEKWGFVNVKGQEVIPPKFSIEPSHFDNCGLAVVQNKEKKFLYINKQGEVVSKEYAHATPFNNGHAFLSIREYSRANPVIDCDEMINSKFEVEALVGNKSLRLLPDSYARFQTTRYYADLHKYVGQSYELIFFEGQTYVRLPKVGYSLLSEKGDVMITGLAGVFSEGLAPVRTGKDIGYVNKQGEWVIKFEVSEF